MILILFFITHPIIDSLTYYYSLNQPDTLFMNAECSLCPDEEIKIYFSKMLGLQVKSADFTGEIVKWLVISTGIGLCEFWKTIGKMDTVIYRGSLLTLIPEEKFLFEQAELKIDKKQWLIKSAKLKIEQDTVFAKITYKSKVPVKIEISGSSNFIIKHRYKNHIPVTSKVILQNSDIPEIEVKYTIL